MVEIASRTCKSQTTHSVVSIFRLFKKQSTQSTLKVEIVICFLLFFIYYFFLHVGKSIRNETSRKSEVYQAYIYALERERAREKKGAFFSRKDSIHIVRACVCVVCVCGAVVVTIIVIVRSRISITQLYTRFMALCSIQFYAQKCARFKFNYNFMLIANIYT